ncbi:MAG: M20/M25/M40 family metallo-hydrolase [Streptosporangiales bacterium]|nr:M20/M25/M40 family metallo-hydrolase [Streptosporangiales bacterium]
MRFSVRRRLIVGAAITAAVVTPLAFMGTAVADPPSPESTRQAAKLQRADLLAGVKEHLANFQQIADANDGTRFATSPGYTASAEYVRDRLRRAGYKVSFQEFSFPFFLETAPPEMAQVSPDATTYEEGTDFATMTYSGSGEVEAAVQPVDLQLPPGAEPNSSTSGCEAADFDGFTSGNIALIQRGTCDFRVKALNAQEAGASGAIIFNEGQEGRTEAIAGTLSDTGVNIPTVGASFAVGEDLADPAETVVRLNVTSISETRTDRNVIAETKGGNKNNVVTLGAHLDSVPEGAGINDNGSGSAAILEVAEQLAKHRIQTRNAIRFAWWGAEEFGLWGSTQYVESLSEDELSKIGMYLNFDMVGSPNFARFLYDGDNSDGQNDPEAPEGSAEIEKFFEDFFAAQDLPTEGTPLNGRSDYDAFALSGIPIGGLFTGAEGVKTEEQATKYGGEAGVAFDPCYHQACDDLSNVNDTALRQNTQAIAAATVYFGFLKATQMQGGGAAALTSGPASKGVGHQEHRQAA